MRSFKTIAAIFILSASILFCSKEDEKSGQGAEKTEAPAAAKQPPAARTSTILIGVETFLNSFPRAWTELTKKPDGSLVVQTPCDADVRTVTIVKQEQSGAATLTFFLGQEAEDYEIGRIRAADGYYLLDVKSLADQSNKTFRVKYLGADKKMAVWEGVYAMPLTFAPNKFLANFPRERAPGCENEE